MISKKLLSIFLLITFVLLATTVVSAADSSDGETAVQSDMQANTVSTSDHTSDASDSSSQATTSSNTQTTTNTHSNSETASSTSDTNTEKTSETNTQTTSNNDNTKNTDTQATSTQTTTKDTTSSQSSVSDVKTSSSDTKEANNTLTTVSSNLVDEKTNLKTDVETSVNSYGDLVSTIDNIKTDGTAGETYTIILEPGNTDDAYYVTSTIEWGSVSSGVTDLIIDGQNQVTIDGNKEFQFMTIASGYSVTLQNITITNCYSTSNGGAINSAGTLEMINSELTSNIGTDGGAIYNSGTLTITNTTFTENKASDSNGQSYGTAGGGAFNNYYGTVTITDSTFTGNTATEDGGAIDNFCGILDITNTVFNGNTAENAGGAIFSTETNTANSITIESSTFTNNKALGTTSESESGRGGAIYCYSTTLTVTLSEFYDNAG